MKETTNQQQKSNRTRNIVIICVAVAIVAAAIVAFFLLRGNKPDTEKQTPKEDLSEMHVFPAIEFDDSLYYKKTVVSYEDESPRDVYYYKIDSLGVPTDEKVHETHYYQGEKKYIDGNIAKDKRDGLWYAYHKNGNVQTMAHYKDGKEEGRYTVYHENGNVYYTGFYKDGKRVGDWKFYDQNENLIRTENFDNK